MELPDLLNALRAHLNAEISGGDGHRIYGRPHDTARWHRVPKMTKTGERTGGYSAIPPDCHSPVHGRCECPPDGSWRATTSTARPEATVLNLGLIDGRWDHYYYHLDSDGWWRCYRPYARAVQRLRGASYRRYVVLMRLLDGEAPVTAWMDMGEPSDPEFSAAGIVRWVLTVAEEEAETQRTRPPRRAKRRVQKSEPQLDAEAEGSSMVVPFGTA